MAVGQQRGLALRWPAKASSEAAELSAALARRMRPERGSRMSVLASRPGLIGVAIDHLDGPDDEDFASIAGLEECVALAERGFPLDRLQRPLREVLGLGRPSIAAAFAPAAKPYGK